MHWLLAGAGAALAVAAQAEVLEITGEFPANNREASFLQSMSVDRIGGQDGPALQIAIERALSGGPIEILGGRAGRDTAEGALSGAVSTSVDEQPFRRKEKRCTAKDADGKCTKEEEVEIRCRRRAIAINADLRIVRNGDGRIVYSEAKPFREEVSWCEGQAAPRPPEEVISGVVRNIAGSVRNDVLPHVDTYRPRVRESTKGLEKDSAKRFKDLVKLTKRDARGACDGWVAMRAEAPGHPSLLFNLGLCAEQRGQYEEALALYKDAARAGASEGNEGADRAMRLIAGREDAQERARRRRG